MEEGEATVTFVCLLFFLYFFNLLFAAFKELPYK